MLRKNHVLAAALVSTLMLSVAVSAQPGPRMAGQHRMAGKMKCKGPADLDLTDEQKAKIDDLRLQLQKEVAPLRAQMVTLQTDLSLLLTADSPDLNKIKETSKKLSELQEQMHMKHIEHQLEVRKLLTAEQRKKFDAHLLAGLKGGPRGPGEWGHGNCARP